MSRLADEAMYFGAVADGVESQQEEIAALRQQLAEFKHGQDAYQQLFNNEKAENIQLRKQVTLLRDALNTLLVFKECAGTSDYEKAEEALEATEPKL